MITDPQVEDYILQYDPDYREILNRLRNLIFQVVPEAKEALKWHRPAFSYQGRNVCYIAGYKKHVSLNFFNGSMLSDPEHQLSGSGKWMKYRKFRKPEDLDEEMLKIWILQAFYT